MLANSPASPQIPVQDIDRAVAFYRDTLGLTFLASPADGVAFFDAGGVIVQLYQRPPSHAEHTLMAFGVEDIDAIVDGLTGRGVMFEQYDFGDIKTDERGIATLGPTQIAWFKDSEGNILAVGTSPL